MLSKKSFALLLIAAPLLADECCCTNPPARPYSPDCFGFYLNVDPVVWQARVNGTGIAVQTQNSDEFFNGSSQSRIQNLNYNWDFGFRLGLGVNTTHDAWDLLLQWTHWSTDASRDIAHNTNFSHFGHPEELGGLSAERIESSWKLSYDLLDLECARPFWVSSCIALRPFGGLRAAWIDQREFDIDLENLSPPLFSHYRIQQSDRFFGIGIRSGLDIQWGVGWGFSFFNNFSANLLYSFHSVKHKEKGNDELLFNVEDFFHVGSAIYDMQIGLRYDWIAEGCCWHLGVDLGWELHLFPGQNQFLLFVDDAMPAKFVSNQGDLGVQGYFLKLRYDF